MVENNFASHPRHFAMHWGVPNLTHIGHDDFWPMRAHSEHSPCEQAHIIIKRDNNNNKEELTDPTDYFNTLCALYSVLCTLLTTL